MILTWSRYGKPRHETSESKLRAIAHLDTGQATSHQIPRGHRILTSQDVDKLREIEEYEKKVAKDNYAAYTNYSGTKDREIPNVQESTEDDYVAWKGTRTG
jgi:hypothetical protein